MKRCWYCSQGDKPNTSWTKDEDGDDIHVSCLRMVRLGGPYG